MKITVIGCGWLGFPLAQNLVSEKLTVYGSTTKREKLNVLENAGIIPFLADENKHNVLPEMTLDSDFVLITIPPSKSSGYSMQIQNLINQFHRNCKIIFTSSISVYKNTEGEVDESSALNDNHPVYFAEQVIKESGKQWIILRLAGLIGLERHPIKYLSGKKIQDAQAAVNLVHLNDVIEVIKKIIIGNPKWHEVYNVCWGEHPSKEEYYSRTACDFRLAPPYFENSNSIGKIILAKKITEYLDFQYSNSI